MLNLITAGMVFWNMTITGSNNLGKCPVQNELIATESGIFVRYINASVATHWMEMYANDIYGHQTMLNRPSKASLYVPDENMWIVADKGILCYEYTNTTCLFRVVDCYPMPKMPVYEPIESIVYTKSENPFQTPQWEAFTEHYTYTSDYGIQWKLKQ